jgi:hypothetical protein
MKSQKSEVRSLPPQALRGGQKSGITCLILLATCYLLLATAVCAAEWPGVDESVVEKYAEEHGRTAREPFINTDQGDVLLFMFLIGGIIGGFAAGYYWRMLTENRPAKTEHQTKLTEHHLKSGEG